MISTRGRYALRVMVDLAEHADDGLVPMKEVAKRQDISLKYLEQILPVLTKNKLLHAVHGKGGGYSLARDPRDITTKDILQLTEKELAPVACVAIGAPECKRQKACKTQAFWKQYNQVISTFLDSKTLADFLD